MMKNLLTDKTFNCLTKGIDFNSAKYMKRWRLIAVRLLTALTKLTAKVVQNRRATPLIYIQCCAQLNYENICI